MRVEQGAGGFATVGFPADYYSDVLRQDCERHCKVDPRLLDEPDFNDLKEAAAVRAAAMFIQRLGVGEPVIVPAGHVAADWAQLSRSAGRSPFDGAPDWLTRPDLCDPVVIGVCVHSDGTAEPATFRDD